MEKSGGRAHGKRGSGYFLFEFISEKRSKKTAPVPCGTGADFVCNTEKSIYIVTILLKCHDID